MPIIFHLTSVTFPETSNGRRGLTQKWDIWATVGSSSPDLLADIVLVFCRPTYFWTKLYVSFVGGDFFSWSSLWIVRWATPPPSRSSYASEHRQTVFMYAVVRSIWSYLYSINLKRNSILYVTQFPILAN